MTPLSETESKALRVVRRWQTEYSNSPSVSELARELDTSYRTALNVLHRIEKKTIFGCIGKRSVL